MPPFHGKRMAGYEHIVEEEVMRELATWPEGEEFATLPSMMRITLNAILRTVFGADGAAFEELRELLPPMVLRASRLTVLPPIARRDYGRWSPWRRVDTLRRRYDAIISRLIADARNDPALEERNDVLALMLQARYEDGSPIADDHVADELLTLLAAGHETTATTLAWAVERLRRHPRLLSRLSDELDAGGSDLLQATIFEVQRTRPVINATARMTKTRIRLGEWVIPERHAILVSISLAHASERSFPDAAAFNPDRFIGNPPDTHAWVPFGGGVRRCIGAAFANMEMMVTLRTLLREFEFGTTYAAGEPMHSRGVATAPGRGGLAVVHRSVQRCAEIRARDGAARGVGVTPREDHLADVGRGITLCHDGFGDPADPPIVLIAGLGQQLHSWPSDFAAALAARGFRVVRFDNRDVGRSTHMDYRAPDRRRGPAWRQPSAAVPPRRHGTGHRRPARCARLPRCAPRRRLDGRDDRSDGRRPLPGPGAHADLDHVEHGCAAHRSSGLLDVVEDGDGAPATKPCRGRRRCGAPLPAHRIARISVRRGLGARAGRSGVGSRPHVRRRDPAARRDLRVR